MSFYPYNRKYSENMQTDAVKTVVDRAFLAHFQVSAAAAVAASVDGAMGLTNLGAAVQHKVTGLTSPAAPRALRITGNVAGITGTVTIKGTNYNDEAISEDIIANGTTTVEGSKAFKAVTEVELPVQNHIPAAQTETIQVTHKADAAGTITMTLTSAGLEGSPLATEIEVELDDTAAIVAGKIADAMNAVAAIAGLFTLDNGEDTDTVTIAAKTPLANDDTLAFSFADTDTTGVTVGASTNGTAGVPYDKIKVGWNDKLGLPFKLAHNTVLYKQTFLNNAVEGTEPTVAFSATALESNTIDLNSALNGTIVDTYLIV